MRAYWRAFVLLLCGTIAPAIATDYYVDGACGTSGDGTTQTCGASGPYKTVTESLVRFAAGNTIFVKAGTYAESLSITSKNGTSGSRIVLQAFDGGTVVLDGTAVSPPTTSGLHISSSSYLTVDGIDSIDWGSSKNGIGVYSNSDNIIVTNFVVSNTKSGVRMDGSTNVTISNGDSSANFFHGIYCDNSDFVTLDALVSHDNTDVGENDGIHLGDCRDVTIEDSVAYNNREQGFDIGGHCVSDDCVNNASSQRVTVTRCVAYDNGELEAVGGFKVGGYKDDTITISNSLSFSNGAFCGFCILAGKDVTLDHVTSYNNGDGVRVTSCSGQPADCDPNYQTGTIVRNSIFSNETDGLTVGNSNVSVTVNYNGYYDVTGDADWFQYKGCSNATLAQFGTYQACSGQDALSGTGDPVFVNAADPNGADNLWFTADDGLLLQASSPYKNDASDGKDLGYYVTSADTTAPSAVSDLAAGAPTYSCITLTWTAPGDDAGAGTAVSYDIRYATSAIGDDTAFNNATPVAGEPTPQVATSAESFQVCNLAALTTYHFAIKTRDEVPNTSTISNSPNATTSSSPVRRHHRGVPFIHPFMRLSLRG